MLWPPPSSLAVCLHSALWWDSALWRCRLEGLGTLLPYHRCGGGCVLYPNVCGHDSRYERTPARCARRAAPAYLDHQRLRLDHAPRAATSAQEAACRNFTSRQHWDRRTSRGLRQGPDSDEQYTATLY